MHIGLDTETENDQLWCVGVADSEGRTATTFLPMYAQHIELNTPVFHNAPFDLSHLELNIKEYEDTILIAHMLGYSPLNLPTLSSILLGVELDKSPLDRPFADDPKAVLDMCSIDAWATYALYQKLAPRIEKWRGLYEEEKQLQQVLMAMYAKGMPVSPHRVHDLRRQILSEMGRLEVALAEHGIELENSDAIAERFWQGKERPARTKSGKLAMDADNLRKNATSEEWEWVELLLAWRKADKFQGTYLSNWVGQEWLHPSLNQTGVATWRFSSSNPNLQNVPKTKATPLYQLFVAPEGYTFISADYSQAELRMLANMSEDSVMIQAYKSGADLHESTLEEFGLVSHYGGDADEARRAAKVINFRITYGGTGYALAKSLGITQKEGDEFTERFYETYPEVRVWQDKQVEHAKEYGYVETFKGRPLWIPCMNAESGKLYHHGRNQCCNYPIQGGVAEIVKDAMRRCAQYLVMQCHDELLYLVPNNEAKDYEEYLSSELVDYRHEIPYTIDIGSARSWGDLKHIPDMWGEDDTEEY